VILAGTTTGIQRSDDGGASWQPADAGLTIPHLRWLAIHPDEPLRCFAGTEPAGLFVSEDGGASWTERPEVAALRDEHQWMLPYSPEAGCVRGFSFHGERIYAAVEVGGLLRSDDGGMTWNLAAGSDGKPSFGSPPAGLIYPDVHDVAVHPSDPNLVFAATGGGFYRSDDGGATWALLYDCYCRALWLDPDDAAHIIFGPADYVGSRGRIETSQDGGHNWVLTSDGLEVPWPRTMPERLNRIGDSLFAVLDDGRVVKRGTGEASWQFVLAEAGRVNALVSG
jgi:photosystem II stability/assembly factor-like uncharacterized protein